MVTLLVGALIFLAACDSVFRIRGVAPSEGGCLVNVIDDDLNETFRSFPVSGPFTEQVIVGGGWTVPVFRIDVVCDGRTIKTVENVNPSYENFESPVDLGTIGP
jgi:hypothetical protein